MLPSVRAVLLLGGMSTLLLVGGCNKRDEPEHIKQQREVERRLKAAAAARKSKVNPTGAVPVHSPFSHAHNGTGAGSAAPAAKKYDDHLWPTRVRAAFQLVWKASAPMTPRATRLLAMQGLEATDALSALIDSRFMPKHKRAAAAFLLARLYMFRPADLARFARTATHQALQRESLKFLARIRNPDVDKLTSEVLKHNPLFRPFVAFARRHGEWKLSIDDINRLDRILQGTRPDALRKDLAAVEGTAAKRLREPLLTMLRSPVTRKQVYMMVGARLIELADNDRALQRQYVEPGYPRVLRLSAARLLVSKGNKADRDFINKLASNPKDPMSVPLRMLLVRSRKGKGKGKKLEGFRAAGSKGAKPN